jgi:integrase
MSPRKASLRVAHQRSCANATKTALDSLGRGSGCTCQPSYYVFSRDRDGRPVKRPRVKDRRTAERAVAAAQREIDEGRAGLGRKKQIDFNTWADEYEEILEARIKAGELHPRTLRNYQGTLRRGRDTFGSLNLDEIGNPELRRLLDGLPEKLRPAARLRYMRELGACFSAAVDDGRLDLNPVPRFTRTRKLKAPKRGKAPFEDHELERLWAELGKVEAVYLYAARFSAETGARLGELIGLDWSNVNLTDGRVLIEYQYNAVDGLLDPKDREPRAIYLTPQAKAVLEDWVGVVGVREEGPVFPHPELGGRLSARLLQRRFAAAMTDAGIPKQHPELRLPRTFHSLRYTTSVLMQRRGFHPRLIEATLGHGSLELTYGVYGGWTPEMLAAEAARDPDV